MVLHWVALAAEELVCLLQCRQHRCLVGGVLVPLLLLASLLLEVVLAMMMGLLLLLLLRVVVVMVLVLAPALVVLLVVWQVAGQTVSPAVDPGWVLA